MRRFALLLTLTWMQVTAVVAAPTNSLPQTVFADIQYAEKTDPKVFRLIYESDELTANGRSMAMSITTRISLPLAAWPGTCMKTQRATRHYLRRL